ncbi:PqqD family protein [Aestuariivirga sp.]|jgi:hypothetical protein|uniref:PqqD family protein n=1 Tax=Aestuariivirga sp. TaxID=2650926 RepID=UPI003784F2A1
MVDRSRPKTSKTSSGKLRASKPGSRASAAGAKPASRSLKPGKAVKPSAKKPRPRKGPSVSSRSGKGEAYIEQAGEWQVIDIHDGIALHDTANTTMHYLNHIAAAVFLLCKQSIAITTVSAIIQEQYELDASPEAAIRKTVNEMMRVGLLKASKKPVAG